MTADWFRLFGVELAEGRGFAVDEDRGGPLTAVVTASLGRRPRDYLRAAGIGGRGGGPLPPGSASA